MVLLSSRASASEARDPYSAVPRNCCGVWVPAGACPRHRVREARPDDKLRRGRGRRVCATSPTEPIGVWWSYSSAWRSELRECFAGGCAGLAAAESDLSDQTNHMVIDVQPW